MKGTRWHVHYTDKNNDYTFITISRYYIDKFQYVNYIYMVANATAFTETRPFCVVRLLDWQFSSCRGRGHKNIILHEQLEWLQRQPDPLPTDLASCSNLPTIRCWWLVYLVKTWQHCVLIFQELSGVLWQTGIRSQSRSFYGSERCQWNWQAGWRQAASLQTAPPVNGPF